MTYKPLKAEKLKYSHIVGTGGIGSGIFFELIGNETLGRNESRLGVLRPYRDYCKLHIIFHYISILLGAGECSAFDVYPIGRVGDDENGQKLISEMKVAGMDVGNIKTSRDSRTLYSICFQYPDSTGGNITTSNSASNEVSSDDITHFFEGFKKDPQGEIVLAVPEVPVLSRIKMLEMGRARGSFNISSVLCSEVEEFKNNKGFEYTDLLAINIDEAKSIAGADDSMTNSVIVKKCIETLTKYNEKIAVIITDGPNGSYAYNANMEGFVPSLKTTAVSTAGAGDAFLAGTITGLCCGLPLLKCKNDKVFCESPLSSAMELGTLLASLSVTSADTIHIEADAKLLYNYAVEKSLAFSEEFLRIFGNVACTEN